ncbi:phage holin family protein [Cryobacterium melibiosiphilum]|uniref:Phage holin family protein n=1 Tax=Cryobacterium melibiosiphilum TaxID=995039 RepID=A0A3A5MTN3_9MICO|nr:phage holin family protein [Cryobacterium melibiosiphilum]RJT91189.1 phage holin family protein [Cryobacterium melibiosiphilum]
MSGGHTAPSGHASPSEQKAADTSLGDLLGEVSRDLSTLMRQELELAKAELTQSATRAGKGAGFLGAAGYAGLMAVLFLSIALWWGLGYLVGNGWSAVIVAVLWAAIGGILYARGRREMKAVRGVPRTAESLKKIPETLNPSTTPSRSETPNRNEDTL